MYNEDALQHSNAAIDEQIEFLLSSRPYIRQILLTDSSINQKSDYLYSIDGVGMTADGCTKTLQFKCRKEGNRDFYIMAKRLSGKAATEGAIGFWYKGIKYALTPQCDIYIETIGGKHYTVTRDEINMIEIGLQDCDNTERFITSIQPKYVYADNGNKFATGDYYVFINLAVLKNALKNFFEIGNPNLYS